jgi:hypothetical protein
MLQHCREGEINCWFSIFRMFHFFRLPKATKDIKLHLLFTVAIPVNYTGEFREIFDGTAYTRCDNLIPGMVAACRWVVE